MSEQEKQASVGKDGSAIVMVEQTASHVKPYRPTDLQQESDVHHKRSKAPAVPSVAEELKNLAEDGITNQDVESMELKESERAMSSEHKHSVSKKNSKKRDLSPDIPPFRPTDPTKNNDATKAMQKTIPSPTQPIPPQIQAEKSEHSVLQLNEDAEVKEEDSIMEEITELQTPEQAKKHSDWVNCQAKKHSVSWNDVEYQRTIVLQDLGKKSRDWFLERKASVGPCFRPGVAFEGPSGIMINVPKKSLRCISTSSGININVSRKSLVSHDTTYQDKRYRLTTPADKMDCEIAYAKFYSTLKDKVNTMRSKIKCAFNM